MKKLKKHPNKLGVFPYIVGSISFSSLAGFLLFGYAVPYIFGLLGIFFGLIVIIWGLVTKKVGGKWLSAIGTVGIFITVIIFIFFHNNWYFKYIIYKELGEFDRLLIKERKSSINKLVSEIEIYHTQKGHYPTSLEAYAKSFSRNSKVWWIYDPPYSMTNSGPRYYYYELLDETHYYLLGVGPDGIPFTSDDIVPGEPYGLKGKTGLVIKRKP